MKMTSGRRTINIFIAVFVLVNTTFPRIDLGAVDYSALYEAIESQSTVLSYASFAALPIQIVNKLFAEANCLPSHGKETPKKADDHSRNTSCDFSIVTESKKNADTRTSLQKAPRSDGSWLFPYSSSRRPDACGFCLNLVLGNVSLLLLLVMLLIMLPRGNLGDHIRSTRIYISLKAQPACADWVFSFQGEVL